MSKQPIISFWKATHKSELSSQLLQCDLEVQDVIIIGAGISGVSTAYFLNKLKPELKICILEKREKIAHGATGNNGGHIWPGLCDSFAVTCTKHGKKKAKELYEFTLTTTQEIEKFCKEAKHGSNVEFERTGSVALATTEEEWKKIQIEYEALKECDIPFVELLTKEQSAEISGYKGTLYGGMITRSAGQLFPARLVYALAAELPASNCKIVTDCNVTSVVYDKEQDLYAVSSQDGSVRVARSVVHATNAWASDILPELKEIIVPVRGQVLATEPLQDIQFPHGLLLNEGYEYLIQRRTDKRVVLGGYRWLSKNDVERNITDDSTINEDVSQGLRQFISQHVGAQVKIDYEWSGIMGFSADCNPLVGKFKDPREYILAGYTGHGMPLAFLCGKLVAQAIATSTSQGNTVDEPLVTFPELLKANRFNSK